MELSVKIILLLITSIMALLAGFILGLGLNSISYIIGYVIFCFFMSIFFASYVYYIIKDYYNI